MRKRQLRIEAVGKLLEIESKEWSSSPAWGASRFEFPHPDQALLGWRRGQVRNKRKAPPLYEILEQFDRRSHSDPISSLVILVAPGRDLPSLD